MEYRRFQNTFVVRIDKGEEIVSSLLTLAAQERIGLAGVQALGAIHDFTVGVLDTASKQFRPNTFTGDHEIVSLTGTLTTKDGAPYCHLHLAAGNSKGQVFGGHLVRAVVSATCELLLTCLDGTVERRFDEATGLNLFHFL